MTLKPPNVPTDEFLTSSGINARFDHLPINLLDSLPPNADVIGDGVVNDAAAIQARFTLGGLTGRPVYVPEPDVAYALGTTSLTIADDDFKLFGVGAKSLFTSSATTQAILVNDTLDLSNIYISYIGITGTYANTAQKGIYFQGATNVIVEGCTIKDCGDTGVGVNDTTVLTKAIFRGNRISHCGNFGINLNSGTTPGTITDVTITENYCDGFASVLSPAKGIYLKGVYRASVVGNICRNLTGVNAAGIIAQVSCRDITITGNVVDTSYSGIMVAEAGTEQVTVTANVIRNLADGCGISVFNAVKGVVVANNTIKTGTGTSRGIIVQNTGVGRPSRVKVIDNYIEATASGGIFTDAADFVTVLNNTIDITGDTTSYALDDNNCTDVLLANNQITGGNRCIMVRGATTARCLVSANTIGGSSAWGIRIDGTATASEVEIHDNDARGFTGTAASAIDPAGVSKCIDNLMPSGLSSSVTAAGTTTLNPHLTYHNVTGGTTITSVTASWKDRVVVLRFASTPTFTDGSNLLLAGNLVATADDTITLVSDGTNWIEMARSVN